MYSDLRRLLITSCLAFAFLTAVKTQTRVPVIWDDAALADWAAPIAPLHIRPGHYKAADYYAVPADNLRTYPVYLPDKEPPGYWESLQKKRPELLVEGADRVSAKPLISTRPSPVHVAEQLRAGIAGAELAIIPEAGHLSNMEQPEVFNAHVRRFCLSQNTE